MSNRGRGGDDKDWVPIVAGVALGIGVLALLYKLMSGGGHCGRSDPDKVCKQTQRPYKCTCGKNDPCQLHKQKNSATELERKRQEIANRSSLKSGSLSRVSSCCSFCSGGDTGTGDDGDRPGLLQAFMMFLRGEITWSQVVQAAGFSGASAGKVGMIGAMAGGGMLLGMLAVMSNLNRKWRKPPESNCIPKRAIDEGPPKIHKTKLRWPPEDHEN